MGIIRTQKRKIAIIFTIISLMSVNGTANECRYTSTTITENGRITKTVEEKTCNEVIELKSFWETFFQSENFTNSLIIIFASLFK